MTYEKIIIESGARNLKLSRYYILKGKLTKANPVKEYKLMYNISINTIILHFRTFIVTLLAIV